MTLASPSRRLRRRAVVLAVMVAAGASSLAARQPATPPTRSHHPDVPHQSPTSLGAASYAKVLCSGVFVSGREEAEIRQNSAYFLMNAPDREKPVTAEVDRQAKQVRVTVGGMTRTAAFYGDQGCVIHPEKDPRIHFTPMPVRTTLPDAASQPWPMGDAPASAPWPESSIARLWPPPSTWRSPIPPG